MENLFYISGNAAKRIIALQNEGSKDSVLRITVNSGGCFGLQYAFDIQEATQEGDHVFHHDQARVVMDRISLDFLKGAELDYVDDMMGAFFTIKNPNATSSCGCGSSFSV
jgi:iron-sulfur cluster insertion protein